jgi:hypothetical protein
MLAFALTSGAAERDDRFDGKISREVLENYLSRAITFTDFLHGKGSVVDKHKVRIELLPEKNPQSTGHEFRVLGLGVAGVKAEN